MQEHAYAQGGTRNCGKADVLLFPAGYYKTQGKPSNHYKSIAKQLREMITAAKSEIIVCFGIDGRDKNNQVKDQIAVAAGSKGIIAMGRKFHPTIDEDGFIDIAPDPFNGEGKYPRMFEIAGKRVFLAVCYDSFGIRQRHLENPDIDIVLNLVHKFNPKPEAYSDDLYFAKYGFAGCAREWRCPTFGAAVFFNRRIPTRWPTGVIWNQGAKETKFWKYSDNPLTPSQELEVEQTTEKALVRIYRL